MTDRAYGDPKKPGRLDINGVEWWACDPYPTWYRWEDGELYTNPAKWADGKTNDLRPVTTFIPTTDWTKRQREVMEHVWQEAVNAAMISDGESWYMPYYIELEEYRYDEDADDLVPTGVFLSWNGPREDML